MPELDALFAPWDRLDAPGLLVGVALEGRAIYRRGFGLASLESRTPNTLATRMRIASTTKHMTCLLALLLVEEGRLRLDSPIRAYLPELRGPAGDATLRQLMQHRGGSRCHIDLGFITRGLGAPPVGDALAAQRRQRGRNFAPGEAMIYNNSGYHLLSIAIERAGGMAFDAQLRTRLFEPLAMADTALVRTDYDICPGLATLHVAKPDGGWRRGLFPSEEILGEGGVVSTIDDMLAWASHLRTRDRFGTPETWASFTALSPLPNGSLPSYALGIQVEDHRGLRAVHHPGTVIGGSCQMLTVPDAELEIVILANGAPGADVVDLAWRVADGLLAGRLELEAPLATVSGHEALLGDWYAAETGMIHGFSDEAGLLRLAINGAARALPLETDPDGTLVARPAGLGDIRISPAPKGDRLDVTFGGRTVAHRPLGSEPADAEAFAAIQNVTFSSHDADATVVVEMRDATPVLLFNDGRGGSVVPLRVLGPGIATAARGDFATQFGFAIDVVRDEADDATALRVNTVRTRDLRFSR